MKGSDLQAAHAADPVTELLGDEVNTLEGGRKGGLAQVVTVTDL